MVLEKTWESLGQHRRSSQSILKEINPEYSLEGLVLNLKLEYFGHLMQMADSLEETLMPGKFKGKRRRGRQRMRLLDGITDSMDMNLGELQEVGGTGMSGVLQSMGLWRVWHDLATELQYTYFVGFHKQLNGECSLAFGRFPMDVIFFPLLGILYRQSLHLIRGMCEL